MRRREAFQKEGHVSKGTEAGNVVVSLSSDHSFSAGVAKFHCQATVMIFVYFLYVTDLHGLAFLCHQRMQGA